MQRYAVLIKTHFWDACVRARLEELARSARLGDVFLFVDESRGHVDVPFPVRVIRSSVADAERIGLARTPPHAVFWYNTDYPVYLAAEVLADYDYVLMLEYDCVINVDIDAMISRVRERKIDFVAEPVRTAVSSWHWLPTLNGAYPLDKAVGHLTCTCVLSRAAWRHLFARRLRLAAQYADGTLQGRRQPLAAEPAGGVVESWPFSEAFMGTDLALAGFALDELSSYGPTGNYDWWPPHLDTQIAADPQPGFYHPVLDEPRYLDSLLRLHHDPAEWFTPGSSLRIRLDACSRAAALHRLNLEFSRRAMSDALRRLRTSVTEEEWKALGLGYDVNQPGRPASSSRVGESPQWWEVDIGQAVQLYAIRLVANDNPMTDTDIAIDVSLGGENWQRAGALRPGHAGELLDLRYDPPIEARYVRLSADTDDTLRTGKLELLADPP